MIKKQNLLSLFLSLLLMLFSIQSFSQDDENEPSDNGCTTLEKISKGARKSFNKAKTLYQERKFSEAMTLLNEVAEEEPTFAESFYLMGKISLKQLEKLDNQLPGKGNMNADDYRVTLINKAITSFSSAINACKDVDISSYFELGKLLYTQNKFKEAASPLDYFIKNADPDKKGENIREAKQYYEYCNFLDKVLNNPVPFNLKRVEGVSSQYPEYLFCVSPDDDVCFYTRVLPPQNQRGGMYQDTKPIEYFYVSIRDSNQRFDDGRQMPKPFNQGENEGSPTITVDNRYMVFAKVKTVNGYPNSDLYYSEYLDEEWSPIKSLGPNINNPNTWETQPSISADGKTLYFITDRDNETKGLEIYVAYKESDGSWGKAQPLSTDINSPGDEKTPFIHSDSQTLYFSSNGHTGVGAMDIYFSKMEENGKWMKPRNIGVPINTESDDAGFFVSTDGAKGYYSSNSSGNFDLYTFDLYAEARPQRVALIKGEITSENGEPIKANVELRNTETKAVIQIPVESSTGKYAMVALLKNDYVLTVKKEGYAYETKYIDSKDTTAPAKHNVDFTISAIEEGKSYRLNDIYFATNSYDLNRECKLVIDAFIEFLTDNSSVVVEIQGHTDNVGGDNENMILSENRAKSVYDYIIANGIESSRLKFKGYGKTKPVASNDTEEGRSKNRRTVFVILKQ
jgi:outer membrane protein OmpA-like peptidoglycan-associated protein/tetratricopeptide (TPR) repeat protein